jgi:hypothetical protein
MDEDLKEIIHTSIQEKDPLKKSLGVLAAITEALKPVSIKPIANNLQFFDFVRVGSTY